MNDYIKRDYVKLKDNVPFSCLEEYGFVEDSANVEPGDHYYADNNYYLQVANFRITVNIIDRRLDILCLAVDPVLYNMFSLEPLYRLFNSNLIELGERS